MFMRPLAALFACCIILAGPIHAGDAAAANDEEKADLVRDRPKVVHKLWDATKGMMRWSYNATIQAVDFMIPPSAHHLASAQDGQPDHFFSLLGLAGYKLKEIENEIGLIPGLSFRFGIARELSEADLDYLDEQMDLFLGRHPGMLGELQGGIVTTLLAINTGGSMQVSHLTLTMLPLPAAKFSITPTASALGEEASTLLRAIQRVDRRIRDLAATEVITTGAAKSR